MVTIATYGDPKVATDVVKGPQASTLPLSNFDTMSKPLADIAAAGASIQQRVGQAQAEQTLIGFERAKNDMLFDPKNGYFSKQGRDAYESSQGTVEALQKLARDQADTITDPAAREAFVRVSNTHVARAQQSVMEHASQGLNAWETANISAQVENTLQNATLYRNDPKQLEVQRILGQDAVLQAGKRKGLDGEALNQNVKDYNSSFTAATVTASIHDSSEAGIAAMNKYGDHLTEPDRIKLEDALEKKQKEEETTMISTVAIAAGRNIATQYYNQGINAARRVIDEQYTDPKINQAVTHQMMSEFSMRDRAKQRDEVNALDQVENYMLRSTPDDVRTVETLKAAHPGIWASLSPKQQLHLQSGALTVTDQNTLLNVKSLTMDQLATLNVSSISDKLSLADRKDVMKMVEDARNGKHDIELQSDAQFTKDKLKQYGLNDEHQQAAIESVTSQLNAAVNAKGEALSPKDRKNIIQNAIGGFVIENSWFKPNTEFNVKNTPIPELSAMNLVAKQLTSAIPASTADTNKIRRNIASVRDALTAAGVPVNRDSILAGYLQQFPIKKNQSLSVPNPNVSVGTIKR